MVTDAEDVFASNGTSGPHSNGTRKSSSSAANGTHKPVSSQNGGPQLAKSVSSTYCGHDRQEMTRILVQALSDMGYHSAAESVIKDSGYDLESPVVAAFRTAVCEGSWEEAEKLLFGASSNEESGEHGNGLILCPGADRDMMRFWLRRQKFLELLENRDTAKALNVLRKELTPLYQDASQLQMLSSLLMCSTPEMLKDAAHWDGAQGQSRRELLSRLSTYISPSVMLPEHRLASLLHQSKRAQIARCLYHSDTSAPSLYSDHMCHRRDFPLETVLVLDKHDGEVWQIKFSHDGKRLATCGLDKQVIIWDVPSFDVVHVLKEHELGVGNISWSPDDSLLVTCSQDRHARLWDMRSGSLIRRLPRQEEPVSSCAWYPDSQHFITGALDKSLSICQWNRSGDKTLDWDKKHRVEDLVLSPDGRWLMAMDDNHHIHIYDSATREKEHELDLNARVYSVSVSQDSKHMLVNNQYGEIKLYDIGSWEVIQDYQTALGDNYVIRSGFGGADQSFVISGGEDGELYIFHRTTGVKVASMHAHRPRCNSVSWNPKDPQMLATCGDDGKIKIWSTKEHIRNISSRPSYSNGNGWRNEEDED